MGNHQHEEWQLRASSMDRGGLYCAACGDHVEADLDWGVRDLRRDISKVVAVHPSLDSALAAVEDHPDWYEVVWSIRPPERKWSAAT